MQLVAGPTGATPKAPAVHDARKQLAAGSNLTKQNSEGHELGPLAHLEYRVHARSQAVQGPLQQRPLPTQHYQHERVAVEQLQGEQA
jgi:hypothetical protein